MLTRIYIDNFRCFVEFEYRPARRQLVLGPNGSGKSSLRDALALIRKFAIKGAGSNIFRLSERTRWLGQGISQIWEVEALIEGLKYVYHLRLDPVADQVRSRVHTETLACDEKPLFRFIKGQVHLYNDDFAHTNTYPFDRYRSALATIAPTADNRALTRFKDWLEGFRCFQINPIGMTNRSEGEHLAPYASFRNMASWYRHLVQSYPRENLAFLESLSEVLDGFDFLRFDPAGENVSVLVAVFGRGEGKQVKIGFHELSDGQRCLICLYAILHFILARGNTVVLDEPDNFVSLREIQPWLTAVSDMVDEGHGQALIISHHTEFMNQWAPSHGIEFVRDGAGPVRVEPFRGDTNSTLSPAELIARGWERG